MINSLFNWILLTTKSTIQIIKNKFMSDEPTKQPISQSLQNTRLRIWLVLFGGALIIATSIIFPEMKIGEADISAFLQNIGKTFLAAATIALILQVPALLNDVNNSSIALFKDNSFLNRLDAPDLQKLRTDATEAAYSKSTNHVEPSLKEIDSKIADLFLQPYYSKYKVNINCEIIEDKYLLKTFTKHIKLQNPSKKDCDAIDKIGGKTTMFRPEGKTNEDIRKLESFEVIIDDMEKWEDLTSKLKLNWEEFSEDASSYNALSYLKLDGRSNLKFEDKIEIKIKETRLVPIHDNTYLHRVSSPVKYFTINYSFKTCDVDLIGNCFGTFQDTKDGGIDIIKDTNSIDITTNKWMLNGNGIIIVHSNLK